MEVSLAVGKPCRNKEINDKHHLTVNTYISQAFISSAESCAKTVNEVRD